MSGERCLRPGRCSAIFVLAALCLALLAEQAFGQTRFLTIVDPNKHAGEFVVPVNKSQVLQLDVPFADLLVGKSEIADVLALTDRSIYVLGKTLGSTSLTIYGRDRELIAVVDLVVTHDIDGLKARLFDLIPEDSIEVRAVNTGIVLSGVVSSASRMQRALNIAQQYTGNEGQVVNMMRVKGSQQVMLSVRFAEVSRTVTKSLGLDTALTGDNIAVFTGTELDPTGTTVDLATGSITAAAELVVSGFASGAGTTDLGATILSLAFDALERKGLLKTLAEPNLIALSGDTASFLAGGEFPVPVAQEGGEDDAAITIEFKEFGVSLAFTPTVLEDGLINLVVSPEVSAIDQTGDFAISTAGFEIPSLVTRRATTTVELRDGQSFAIAGLLQEDFSDSIRQFPWLGEVPVLGTLFRSTSYQRRESELVILVTPRLVQPASAGTLATPADRFIPPSDEDLFLFGRLEAPESGIGPLSAGGGIEGSYGHIIK